MSPTVSPELILTALVTVLGFIVSIYTARNSASAQQQQQNTANIQTEIEARKQRDAEINAEFDRLREENARLGWTVTEVRAENDRLYSAQIEQRKANQERDEEYAKANRLRDEEYARANRLRDAEITKLQEALAIEKVRNLQMNAYLDVLVAALKRGGIEVPAKPGTGPLA